MGKIPNNVYKYHTHVSIPAVAFKVPRRHTGWAPVSTVPAAVCLIVAWIRKTWIQLNLTPWPCVTPVTLAGETVHPVNALTWKALIHDHQFSW